MQINTVSLVFFAQTVKGKGSRTGRRKPSAAGLLFRVESLRFGLSSVFELLIKKRTEMRSRHAAELSPVASEIFHQPHVAGNRPSGNGQVPAVGLLSNAGALPSGTLLQHG